MLDISSAVCNEFVRARFRAWRTNQLGIRDDAGRIPQRGKETDFMRKVFVLTLLATLIVMFIK